MATVRPACLILVGLVALGFGPGAPAALAHPRVSTGAGPGGGPHVKTFDGTTGAQLPGPIGSLLAYSAGFTGGVRVALCDFNGDGTLDLLTGAGPGGGPHVRVFDGVTGTELTGPIGSFFAYDPAFAGGVYVACGDVTGDGTPDIITGAGVGGGPHVRVFDGTTGAEVLGLFAFPAAFTGGVRVAACDLTGDGKADVAAAAGPGGGPHVRVFDGTTGAQIPGPLGSFFAYDAAFLGGVFVGCADVSGDGTPDVVTGAGIGGGPHVRVFDGVTGIPLPGPIGSMFAYPGGFTGGVRVAACDLTGDGQADLVTGAGMGGGPHVRAFDGATGNPLPPPLGSFFAFDPSFLGGVHVGCGGSPGVNDPPVNTVPGPQTAVEDSPLTFSTAGSNAISVADPDAGSNPVQVTLSASNGTLTLAGTAGLSFTVGDGTGDATMTFTGTLSAVNAALEGMTFTPTTDFTGAASVSITTNDQGATGTGGPQSDTDAVDITVEVETAPTVSSTTPAGGATGVALAANVSVTFSEPVNVSGSWFEIACATSGSRTVANTLVTGGPTTFTLDPNADFSSGEQCTLTVFATQVTDQDTSDPPDTMVANFTATFTVAVVNEAPVVDPATFTVDENSANGTAVGTVTFTDGNPGQTHTFAITGGNTGGAFAIDGGTGAITVANSGALNFETTPSFGLTVQVTDNGAPPLSGSATITVNLTDLNEAPVLTAGGGSPTFTEDGGPVAVDNAIAVTDPDSPNLASAAVTITNLSDPGQEILAANTAGTSITASYAAPTLTLSGSATLAHYQQVLRSVTYNNSSQAPGTTARVISFVANDGTSPSNTATKSVTVTAVNDAPVLTAGGALPYTENQAATAIDTTVTVADADSATLASATVQITGNCTSPQDVLGFTPQSGITGVYTPASCLMTLTGSASPANYQTALRNVKYNNTSEDPSTLVRTVTWQVDDGGAVNNLSNTATSTINVTAVNDPPVASPVTINAVSGIPIALPAGTLSGTDVEPGTTVTIDTTPTNVAAGASVTINANGSFSFIPPGGATGATVGFQYRVCDDGRPGPGVCGSYVNATFNLNGPAIHYVKSVAAGTGNCTLGNECTLATALGQIGANTSRRIFISDSASHTATPTLNDGGWIVGQGVVGTDFDTVMGTAAAVAGITAGATIPARPAINAARPTVNGTVTAHNGSNVRGLNVSVSGASQGLVASSKSGIVVSELGLTAVNGNAVNLTSTSAGFTNFTIAVSGSGGGFISSGVGTITATQNNTTTVNTISTSTGTALSVTNTTIGATGLTFRSISANGAANGIVLNNTGSSGGLTVTGLSAAGSGGTIQNSTGIGVSLTSTTNVSLSQIIVQNSNDAGIKGISVSGFSLDSSTINANGNSTSDDGIQFGEFSGTTVGVTGAVSITNCSVNGNAHNNFHLRNTSGTISSFTVTDSSFNNLNDTFGANAFLYEMSGTAITTAASMTGNTFDNNSPQRALEVQTHDTARIGGSGQYFVVSGNAFTNNGLHASFTQDTSSNLAFKFMNNGTSAARMTSSTIQAINVFSSSQAMGGTIVGTISGNFVGTTSAGAISAVIQGQTDATLLIDGNDITGTNGDSRAVSIAFRGPANPLAGTLPANTVVSDLTITNNSVTPGAAPSGFPLAAIVVEADNQTGADNKAPTVHADIRNNVVPATPVFDLLDANIVYYEYDAVNGHGIGELFDSSPPSANATAQLTSTNTGTAAAFGVALTTIPVNTPP